MLAWHEAPGAGGAPLSSPDANDRMAAGQHRPWQRLGAFMTEERTQATKEQLVRGLGLLVLATGILVLLGWALDLRALKSVVPGAVEMKANTGLALALVGFGLVLAAGAVPKRLRHAQLLGAAVSLLALATLSQYVFGIDLGIDELLVRDTANAYNALKGRMSPYSAVALACAGLALAGLGVPLLRPIVRACAVLILVIGGVSLMGYFWNAQELVTDFFLPPVAVHTAAAFVAAGVALMLAQPQRRPRAEQGMHSIEVTVLASFIGAMVLVAGAGGLTYGAAAEHEQRTAKLVGVHMARVALADFHSDVTKAVLAQRTYLLTGDPVHRRAFAGSVAALADRQQALEALLRSTSASEANLQQLRSDVQGLVATLSRTVEAYDTKGFAASRALVLEGRGTQALVRIEGMIQEIEVAEQGQQALARDTLAVSRHRTLVVMLITVALVVLVLVLVFRAVRREMTARGKAEGRLRKRTEEAVSANRFLESLIQHIPAMVFVKDAVDLRFVRINAAAERLIGLPAEKLLGRTDHDLFPASEADFFTSVDRKVLLEGKVHEVPEESLHTATGEERVLATKKVPIVDAEGRATHLLGIAIDVTEAKNREKEIAALNAELRARAEEVEAANNAKSVFLATVSHEIRTPMNAVLGMLEMLGLSGLTEDQRNTVEVARESSRSLLRIINDILDLSKIEAGKLDLHVEPILLRNAVRDVRTMFSGVASGKGLVITEEIDAAVPEAVWADPVRLRQVLANFISNAVKFSERGQVAIEVSQLAVDPAGRPQLRFSVRDTGRGIPPEVQEKLFQPFVQGEGAAVRTAGGTGLGLAICRRLCELMGGTVSLESTVGTGTVVSAILPLRSAAAADVRANAPEDLRAKLGARRAPLPADEALREGTLVLIVDDHPVNRLMLQQQLNALGYTCEAASDGAEALAKWRTREYGLVLTDCHMEGMDGYELARTIRAEEEGSARERVPVIACTARAGAEEAALCLQAGMNDYLAKPVGLADLIDKLEWWLPLPADGAGTAPPASADAGPALDLAGLQDKWQDPARLKEVLAQFVHSLAQDVARMRAAVLASDAAQVSAVAHRILGAALMVGAQGCVHALEQIRTAAHAGQWAAAHAGLLVLEGERQRVGRQVQEA